MNQSIPTTRVRSWAGRLATTMAAVLGLTLPASFAMAQQVSPEAAPKAWVDYAQTVTGMITEWLRSDSEAAMRLRTYVDGLRPDATASSPPVVLRVWLDSKGVITKVEFPPFAHEEANNDMRSLLVGRAVSANPPRGMLLPLLLAVQLDPAPEPASGPVTGAEPGPHGLRS